MSEVAPSGTLRRRILVAVTVAVAIPLAGFAALFAVNDSVRRQLATATSEHAEEQRIADEITRQIMRQLLTVSAMRAGPDSLLEREFRAASADGYEQIQRYLLRELTLEQRRQLEMVKEAHQTLEVDALRSADLLSRGPEPGAEAAADSMVAAASRLWDEVGAFVSLREADLRLLGARQDATFRATYVGGALFTLLLVVGAALLARFLNRRVGEPLTELAAATSSLARGDLSARVREGHDSEVAVLAEEFNHMAEALEEVTRDLARRNGELTEALARLRATQEELMAAEKLSAMGRMTAGLAHQLNNPLTSVLGFGELLALRLAEDGDPRAREIADSLVMPIVQESRRAHGLVRDFLQFSRRAETHIGPVPLREALDVVLGLRGFAFREAGLAIEVGDVPDVPVMAERQRLQESFLNVVNNALDVMRPTGAGTLHIHGETHDGRVTIHFDDTGPGIDRPDRVFEPFYTTKPVGEGTGLGLALAHRFMAECGGTVRAENRREGGARLSFVLERAAPATGGAGLADPALGAHAADERIPPETPNGDAAGTVVLVLDDEPNVRALHKRILESARARVLLAANASEGRAALGGETVDLVVCDVKMPGESGLDFYRWLKEAHPELVDRFLFVTGDVADPEIASLAEERPEIFVHKPFNVDDYLARVGAVLS